MWILHVLTHDTRMSSELFFLFVDHTQLYWLGIIFCQHEWQMCEKSENIITCIQNNNISFEILSCFFLFVFIQRDQFAFKQNQAL